MPGNDKLQTAYNEFLSSMLPEDREKFLRDLEFVWGNNQDMGPYRMFSLIRAALEEREASGVYDRGIK